MPIEILDLSKDKNQHDLIGEIQLNDETMKKITDALTCNPFIRKLNISII